ncbi:MAG: NAD(P)-binding domain-containing protein [Pelagibacteraceae bacterium]|nr:NAD(P)-binding domain-containing protein [Pelagibacteraceae bacterium]
MKLGFIGTGTITTAVIDGLLKSKAKVEQFNISLRSKKNSSKLKKKSKKIKVYSKNQDIINQSSIVFISLLPKVAKQELIKLKFKKGQIVISFVSTLNFSSLKKLCKPAFKIIKAAPLPMAMDGLSPTIIYPYQKTAKSLFELIGTVVVAKNENQNNHLWVMSSFMATYVTIINNLKKYLQKNKVQTQDANKYLNTFLTGMLFEINNHRFDLDKSIKSLQTKGGINEELLKRLEKDKFFKTMQNNLNKIYLRIKKANDQ